MEKVKNLFGENPARKIPDFCLVTDRTAGVEAAWTYLSNKTPARERWLTAEEALVLIIGILLGVFIASI